MFDAPLRCLGNYRKAMTPVINSIQYTSPASEHDDYTLNLIIKCGCRELTEKLTRK